jgi:hypothetical protein
MERSEKIKCLHEVVLGVSDSDVHSEKKKRDPNSRGCRGFKQKNTSAQALH